MQIKPTKREVSSRVVVYGTSGAGKTTFAAGAPACCFVTAEDGLVNVDSMAIEPAPQTWEQTLAAIEYVRDKTDRKTLAVDSLDWLEPMCWDYVIRKANKKSIARIEDFGYGKGYVAAVDEWRVMVKLLSSLRDKGINVVLIAHALLKPFRNPEGDDFDRYQMKLHVQASGLFKEWADVLGFAQVEMSTYKDNERAAAKGVVSGRRILRTAPSAAFDAKTRYTMPASIALDWPTFSQYVTQTSGAKSA